MKTPHKIGDRVKVLHNIPLGNLIGTVKAIHQRPKHDVYEVELDGGGTDSLYADQLEPITKIPETDEEIEEFIRACDAGEIPEPPPMNTAKLMARMCVMKSKIETLEAECTRLHGHWHAAEEKANVWSHRALKEQRKWAETSAALRQLVEAEEATIQEFNAKEIDALESAMAEARRILGQCEADESADGKPDCQEENDEHIHH